MNEDLTLVRLDADYCNYLRKYDDKVPYNYGKKGLRPFVGALFKINDMMYFAPLSSPKPKHLKLKNKIDFMRIDNGSLGAINFNNMLPVTKKNVILLDLSINTKYNVLLKEQLRWLNRNKKELFYKSKKLYNEYFNNKLDYRTLKRCCNFKLLEEKCMEYNKVAN